MKKGRQSMPSSTLSLTIIFVLAFVSLVLGDNAKSCSDDFARLTQQRNLPNCKKLRTLGAEFGWNYHNGTNSTEVLEILFGAKLINAPNGWIAWGVNPGKWAEMIGTKAIVGIQNPNGSMKAETYDITKDIKSGCRLLPHDLGFPVSNISMEYDKGSGFHTIAARLDLPSSLYNITRLNHVWQVGYAAIDDQPLGHPTTLHNVDSTETITLISGDALSTRSQSRSFLRSVHGVLNIIGWGTFLPIGVIVARYLRVFPFPWKQWFNLHIFFQLTGFLVGTAGWVIGLYLGNASRYYTFHTHRTFGIVIFTFSTIQMLAFRLKPKETDEYRKYWNMYHHFLGYGLLAIIFVNIFKGISILKGGEGWRWAYIGILVLLGAVTFVFEILTWGAFFMEKMKEPQGSTETKQTPSPQESGTQGQTK